MRSTSDRRSLPGLLDKGLHGVLVQPRRGLGRRRHGGEFPGPCLRRGFGRQVLDRREVPEHPWLAQVRVAIIDNLDGE